MSMVGTVLMLYVLLSRPLWSSMAWGMQREREEKKQGGRKEDRESEGEKGGREGGKEGERNGGRESERQRGGQDNV